MKKLSFSIFLAFSIIVTSLAGSLDFNVLDFGTIADSAIVSTSNIQSAIDKCYQSGGGRVYFPPGKYKSANLVLKDNVCLYLEVGATLFASRDTNDYKMTQNNSGDIIPVLIYARGAINISIMGKGTIDGCAAHKVLNVTYNDDFMGQAYQNARKIGIPMIGYQHVKPITCMLYIEECSFVTLRDIRLVNSQFWTTHLRWSDHIYIDNVYISSDMKRGVNADGLDIDGCQNVTISNSIVETGDDALVLKTTSTLGISRPCENISVTNCIFQSSSTAIKLGTESHADFRYITINNCVVRDSNRGLSIVIRDGATAENILFSNIVLELKRRDYLWWGNADPIWLVVRQRTPSSKIGTIRNVSFDNIIAHGEGTSKLEGLDAAHPLQNIKLNNVQLFMHPENYLEKRADDAFYAVNLNQLKLQDVSINWDTKNSEPLWRNAFTFSNIENLNLDKLTGAQAPNNAGVFIELNSVKNAIIENCIPNSTTTTFVKVNDANCAAITLDGNYILRNTRKIEFAKGVKKYLLR
jgi:hypothetical protein